MPTSTMRSNQSRIGGTMGTVLRGSASENARGSIYLMIFVVVGLTVWAALIIVLGALAVLSNLAVTRTGRAAAHASGPHASSAEDI